MFEKEAEELIEESKRLYTTPRETVYKAIEFGYNKANEWHYVKDGDLPPEDTKVLAFMASGEVFIAHFYRKNVWDKIGIVIAWKEIIFPELPKESE